jgi:2-oxoglutarate ferredoxin oxidoreductase subunit gamma
VELSIIFAGFGGQGILFAGKVLARAAMNEGREVLWIPSYGPEMRGGTASCTVIVGDEPIGSPVVDQVDAVVVLNPPSHARFAPRVAPGGLLVANETLISDPSGREDIIDLRIPCTRLATDAGDDSLVSVVALGALVGRLQIVRTASLRTAIRDTVGSKRPEVLAADLAAFDVGHRVGARSRRTGLEAVRVPV